MWCIREHAIIENMEDMECTNAGKRPCGLIWFDLVCGPTSHADLIRLRYVAKDYVMNKKSAAEKNTERLLDERHSVYRTQY